ncbi:MAG: C1 family peptidase [Bacteroidota bacterium]
MSNIHSTLYFLLFMMGIAFIPACDKDEDIEPDTNSGGNNDTEYLLGWSGEDDLDEVPASTNFGFGTGSLPSRVDLVPHFPPIGNQGQYATCVSWAVAYNVKTAISGMRQGLSTSDLAASSNQFSPKDLFLAIPDHQKGPNCGGTNFANALEVLQDRGVASMRSVPYDRLGNCSQSNLQSSWTNEASQHKIKYWRKIEASVQSIKQNLANNVPIILGAKLADNFMSWNSDNVISSSTSYNNVGQHAYHAMVIAGYDDNKGPNGAFKVINSWGEFWGDRGYIWVDYDFMIREFCTGINNADKPLFIAADEEGSVSPPDDPSPNVSGVDLAPWIFSDYSSFSNSGIFTERIVDFNIYNIGNQTASSNADWSFYYIYFNAYDANDYGVLFYDEFNTSVAPNTYYCPYAYNCTFNVSIPSGANFTQMVWGLQSQNRTYYMPDITGYYYLVLIADVEDKFAEQNELNNLFYATLEPQYFDGGYGLRPDDVQGSNRSANGFEFANDLSFHKAYLRANKYHTPSKETFKNAYTSEEIMDLIKREHLSGKIREKVSELNGHLKEKVYRNK